MEKTASSSYTSSLLVGGVAALAGGLISYKLLKKVRSAAAVALVSGTASFAFARALPPLGATSRSSLPMVLKIRGSFSHSSWLTIPLVEKLSHGQEQVLKNECFASEGKYIPKLEKSTVGNKYIKFIECQQNGNQKKYFIKFKDARKLQRKIIDCGSNIPLCEVILKASDLTLKAFDGFTTSTNTVIAYTIEPVV